MTEILEKAQKRQNELSEKINSSKEILAQRPLFHFATPGGWCNDRKIHLILSGIMVMNTTLSTAGWSGGRNLS